tara:strand:- start:305 stop:523 length:219 start_codon:yes stop_codon:yes gene_type:complete
MTEVTCVNGTERISRNLHHLPAKYEYVINVQADEPFIGEQYIYFHIFELLNGTLPTYVEPYADPNFCRLQKR